MMTGIYILLLVTCANLISCHHFKSDQEHMATFRNFSQNPGLMVSFMQRIVSGEFFLGFHAWDKINRKYGTSNISYVVRVEFDRWSYRHKRLSKSYHRFWIPGALWVERHVIGKEYYNRRFNFTRSKNSSVIDIWVEPKCFLRNHGISRIYRVTRSLRMHVYNLRWLAKLSFPTNQYQSRELKQLGNFVTHIPGIHCAWIHPRGADMHTTSLLLKFDKDLVTGKKLFSPEGYHSWDELNDQYQVMNIAYLRGWNRALLDFTPGLHCKKSLEKVAFEYKSLPGIKSVFRDEYKNCRLTYRILVKFNPLHMTPASIHYYNDWSSLNYMYGVVNISYHEDEKLVAHLEFEPGLYNNHQMKAIRSEYLKLKGVLFAWVEGVHPHPKTRMILKMGIGTNLRNYTGWNLLNTKYFVQVLYIDHNRNEATLELPQDKYSEDKINQIYEAYRNIPEVRTVTSKPFKRNGVKISGHSRGISALRRTIWGEVDYSLEKENSLEELQNETRNLARFAPLYHKNKNRTDQKYWDTECDFH